LVPYDVALSRLDGRCRKLGQFGHAEIQTRQVADRLRALVRRQACPRESGGLPVAIEVFEGNVADPNVLSAQIAKLKERFAMRHVVLVGDRGMITQAHIDEELRPNRHDWITDLRAPAIRGLIEGGAPQLSSPCSARRSPMTLLEPSGSTPPSSRIKSLTPPRARISPGSRSSP
jgi:hypothetical protein